MKKNEKFTITLDDQIIDVCINRKKIKNTYIRINEQKQIIVNTNLGTSVHDINKLILKHQNQILKQIQNKVKSELPSDKIMYLGRIYHLTFANASSFAYNINNDTIILYTNKDEKLAIEEFYRLKANEIFAIELIRAFSYFEKQYKLTYPTLEIRKMKNRYGTCYYKRNKICLNLYLIKHDIECINYVINHELCHFIHHDHSRNFYNLLETVVKNHKELKTKLFNF